MNNFQKLSVTELQNVSGGRRKGGFNFGSWWRGVQRGKYGVVQRGGKGNSLGRIIFRFDNNFSVYLHDTSSQAVFSREDRDVSHGCIRVEKPFELAKFLLHEKNEKLIQRINYSMTADSLKIKKLVVGSVKVEPQIPLFITYYTLYPFAKGVVSYPDVYGFDGVIFEHLRKYL